MKFNETLLLERRRHKLASYKLAVTAGIDPTTYSRIENGKQQPTAEQMAAIAAVLGVTSDSIFTTPQDD